MELLELTTMASSITTWGENQAWVLVTKSRWLMHTKTHLIHQNQDQNDYQNNASISEQEAEMERINYKL